MTIFKYENLKFFIFKLLRLIMCIFNLKKSLLNNGQNVEKIAYFCQGIQKWQKIVL